MTQDQTYPTGLTVAGAGRRLVVDWDDGDVSVIGACRLRAASRSAGSVRDEAVGAYAAPAETLAITDIEMIGAYAVRLVFSDGHDRGIYPWRYLRELGAA